MSNSSLFDMNNMRTGLKTNPVEILRIYMHNRGWIYMHTIA